MLHHVNEYKRRERFADALKTGEEVSYQRAKIMFLGKERAGKTSTIKSILYGTFDEEEPSTKVASQKAVEVSVLLADKWREQHLLPNDHFLARDLSNFFRLGWKLDGKEHKDSGIKFSVSSYDIAQQLRQGDIAEFRCFTKQQMKKQQLLRDKGVKRKCEAHYETIQERISLTFWDFAGQQVFYSVHHLFLSDNGIVVLCYNLRKYLEQKETEFMHIRFWIYSIYLNARQAPLLLVGTHCQTVSFDDMRRVDADLATELNKVFKELRLITNKHIELCFFPVDNSLRKDNKKFLYPLKLELESLLSGTHRHFKLSYSDRKVKLAWVYLLDVLVKEGCTHIPLTKVKQMGEKLGFKKAEILALLRFYDETGTILFFVFF